MQICLVLFVISIRCHDQEIRLDTSRWHRLWQPTHTSPRSGTRQPMHLTVSNVKYLNFCYLGALPFVLPIGGLEYSVTGYPSLSAQLSNRSENE